MRRKIFGILVVLLLVATGLSSVGGLETKMNEKQKGYSTLRWDFEQTVVDKLDVSLDSSTFSVSGGNQVYHIYEGLHWRLYVTAYWDPPQGLPICIWVDPSTLPSGATITPPGCTCGIDSVTVTLDWTPAIGQAGTYVIRFYVGSECYIPISYFDITVVVHPYVPQPSETYRICAGEPWELRVTVCWDPPQPERLICLWVHEPSLPEGATFDDCHCDYGCVTSTLRWTPTSEQVGEYIITFLAGEDCGYYAFPFSIKVIVEECEDTIPPTTTKTIGDPKYQDGYFVNSSTPFTLVAHDNEGGSGVKAIYYRIWSERTGWTEWKEYTGSFTLPKTSGNCKYYIEYYAVDKAGNKEEVHNQTHIVDNERPYTTSHLEAPSDDSHTPVTGGTLSTSGEVIVNPKAKLILSPDDICCDKVKRVRFKVYDALTLQGNRYFCNEHHYKAIKLCLTNTKGEKVESVCKLKLRKWGEGYRAEGEVEIDLGDAADCKVTLSVWYYDFKNWVFLPLPVFREGKNEFTFTCKWLREIVERGGCIANIYTEQLEPVCIVHLLALKILDFDCIECATPKSGFAKEQYRIDAGNWIDLTDPEDIARQTFWNLFKDEQQHKIEFRARDNLQQDEYIKGIRLRIDATPPITNGIESPTNNEETNATPKLRWQPSTDSSGITYLLEIAKDSSFNNIVFRKRVYFTPFYLLNITERLPQGKYYWRIKAVDLVDNEGEWSNSDSFTVGDSTPPSKPSRPSGPASGKIGEHYTYTTSTTDPEGNKVYYNFSWGDGTYSGWIGPYAPGETTSASHNWSEKGTYQVKVKALDEYGKESEWSDPLPVTMPKRTISYRFVDRLLELLPFLGYLLNIP
ncbi:MAG: hypothetical protein DRN12_04665 [Thermoplasmata archaeon]|nr:MAG: hypothetical protein DRN12_04665 [Thermoplasmata archaeon]